MRGWGWRGAAVHPHFLEPLKWELEGLHLDFSGTLAATASTGITH